jgi:hypothetical protein
MLDILVSNNIWFILYNYQPCKSEHAWEDQILYMYEKENVFPFIVLIIDFFGYKSDIY